MARRAEALIERSNKAQTFVMLSRSEASLRNKRLERPFATAQGDSTYDFYLSSLLAIDTKPGTQRVPGGLTSGLPDYYIAPVSQSARREGSQSSRALCALRLVLRLNVGCYYGSIPTPNSQPPSPNPCAEGARPTRAPCPARAAVSHARHGRRPLVVVGRGDRSAAEAAGA